jgi:murein DD-endopeptidase MepM/ murein hydrolase activator NlpD
VITETIHKKTSSDYSIKVSGKINIKTKLKIKLHRCKEKTIWDPRTYFMCVYEEYKEISYMTKTRNLVIPDISTNNYTIDRQISNNGAYSFTLSIEKNLKGKDLYIKFKRTISDTVVGNRFVFVEMTPKSNIIQIPAPSTSQSYKPLDFMFKNYYGVTQWHGYTAYMSPHTGIDFGATKEEVVAPADGVVVATGWDNYYGECLSGGKYLKIKHKDDLYSIYFHLSKIHKNIGDIVEKGENIAISGNTGAFNCQPLAYHLHFETRNSSSQESHTDPVLLVNANWNKIPTLGWKQYPGRLSGDNPHPDF